MDLPDDLCFEPTSTAVKVARKFQPKGPLQEKNEKLSKPSASITNGAEHADAPILASNSILIDDSPYLPSQEAATNDESTRDVAKGSALPPDLGSFDNCPFEPSPSIDGWPHSEDSHFLCPQSNERQEVPTDFAHEFNEAAHVTFHAEPELPNFNRVSATEIEQPSWKETTDHQDAEPFDDALSESLSSIARGVGKFHLKSRMRGLAVRSKQQRRKVGDEAQDVNEEEFGSFDAFRVQEGYTEEISGLEKATQDSDMNKRPSRKRKRASDESNLTKEDPPKKKFTRCPRRSSRKRKKASDESNLTKEDPLKKKFTHSTRRKRRQVDKSLLEMAEDEIDSRKLRIRDLIMLSEARERMPVKAGSAGISENNRSNGGHSSSSYHYDHDSAYTDGQDPNYEDEDTIPEVDASSIKLNYHTYMKRSRREKWSKTDIELFYQAIRQFGTDFGMIQQLFPDKTRHQVHLKFKSEERKHPLQIADALVHRSKEHSHFKQVIEQLKAKAEKEEAEELASEYRDEATAAVHEDGGIKNSDGEDQEMNDMGYDGGASKYEYTEESFDWDEYEYNDEVIR